jgi:aminopeptidase-like protein
MIQASREITNFSSLNYSLKSSDIGQQIYQLISRLYPICRSITGNGVRETLKILQEYIPLKIAEIPTGTEVFDWSIPKEWDIRDAYIKNLNGEKIIDFQECNLHVVNYSVPIHQVIGLAELKAHLHTLPEYPDRIPYRTSYYKETWGFCLSHEQLQAMQDEQYEVYIDSSLEPGSLTYGEYYLPGESQEEILISCHTCHPSLCNDNLSGISLATFLAKHLSQIESRRYSYRFLFIPGTIGSITWLALNEQNVNKIAHGLVVTGVGDAGKYTYKKSRRGNADVDRAAIHVLQNSGAEYQVIDFFPYGYDERQYCSPGFNLPVGCFMRSSHGQYSEYHTSADNLSFVKPEYLGDSFAKFLSILYVLENNRTYFNQNPKCEPRLGKRGLYRAVGGHAEEQVNELALLWVLNLSDGEYSLLDIAERAKLSFEAIEKAADALLNCGLLQVEPSNSI